MSLTMTQFYVSDGDVYNKMYMCLRGSKISNHYTYVYMYVYLLVSLYVYTCNVQYITSLWIALFLNGTDHIVDMSHELITEDIKQMETHGFTFFM